MDSQGIRRDCHGHAIDKEGERHKKDKSPFKEDKPIPPKFIDLHGHSDNKSVSFSSFFIMI